MKKRIGLAAILVAVLFVFEVANFVTTGYALDNLLGDLKVGPLSWSVVFAVAFCGIDSIFLGGTPELGRKDGSWFLITAWLIVATMNAALTWWAILLAMAQNPAFGAKVLDPSEVVSFLPWLVAFLVLACRIVVVGLMAMVFDSIFLAIELAMRQRRQQRLMTAFLNRHSKN